MLRISRLYLSLVFVVALVGFVFPLAQEGAICAETLDTWTARTSGTTKTLYDITYVNNMFIAVGESGTILTSPDGETWTSRTSGTSNDLQGVTYGNGTFVAVSMKGTILTSTDGAKWTIRTSGTSNDLYGKPKGVRS